MKSPAILTRRMLAAMIAVAVVPALAVAQQHRHRAQDSTRAVGQDRPMMLQEGMMMQAGGMSGNMAMMSGMMKEMGMMNMPVARVMRKAMPFEPGDVLGLRESLRLTSDQISRLEQLEEARKVHSHQLEDSEEMSSRLEELFDADQPDPSKVWKAAREAMQAHAFRHASILERAAAVRGILTAEQREQAVRLSRRHSMMVGTGMHKEQVEGEPSAIVPAERQPCCLPDSQS